MSARARFDEKFLPCPMSGCWLWAAATCPKGYGRFAFKGRNAVAPRVSWELYVGEIPSGMCVLHRCDTPACVNPSHLFLGTHSDNMADMSSKNRHGFIGGEVNGRSKLTDAAVDEIRRLAAGGASHGAIASAIGVARPTVSGVLRGEAWGHL